MAQTAIERRRNFCRELLAVDISKPMHQGLDRPGIPEHPSRKVHPLWPALFIGIAHGIFNVRLGWQIAAILQRDEPSNGRALNCTGKLDSDIDTGSSECTKNEDAE